MQHPITLDPVFFDRFGNRAFFKAAEFWHNPEYNHESSPRQLFFKCGKDEYTLRAFTFSPGTTLTTKHCELYSRIATNQLAAPHIYDSEQSFGTNSVPSYGDLLDLSRSLNIALGKNESCAENQPIEKSGKHCMIFQYLMQLAKPTAQGNIERVFLAAWLPNKADNEEKYCKLLGGMQPCGFLHARRSYQELANDSITIDYSTSGLLETLMDGCSNLLESKQEWEGMKGKWPYARLLDCAKKLRYDEHEQLLILTTEQGDSTLRSVPVDKCRKGFVNSNGSVFEVLADGSTVMLEDATQLLDLGYAKLKL